MRRKSIKRSPDCHLKGAILNAVLNGKHTGPSIYANIECVNRSSFNTTVTQLRKDGYLTTKSKRRPYAYNLTKKGKVHADDPFVLKKWRALRTQREVQKILLSDERFRQEVERMANSMPRSMGSIGGGSVRIAQNENGDFYFEEVPASENENVDMKIPNRNKSSGYVDHDNNRLQRMDRRIKLVMAYGRDEPLNKAFFDGWKNQSCYLMAGYSMTNLKRGAIEILGINNAEVVRYRDKKTKGKQHINHKLIDWEIIACEITILKTDKEFVYLQSPYFRKPVIRKRW